MTQYELESRWGTSEGLPGVSYRFSDLVCIKAGDYSGQIAEVIALLSTEPEPIYVVVLPPDETSVILPQSELAPLGTTAKRTLKLVKRNADRD